MYAEKICDTIYTYDWVVEQLYKHFKCRNARIKSKNAEKIGQGQGFLSVILRLTFEWEDEQGVLPKSIVLKMPTVSKVEEIIQDDKFDAANTFTTSDHWANWICAVHNNECYFYELMREAYPKPLLLPTVYGWKSMMSAKEPGALVMEDFESRDCGIINSADGMTIAQIMQVIDNMAALYAWVLKRPDNSWTNRIMCTQMAMDNTQACVEHSFDALTSLAPEMFPKELVKKALYVNNVHYTQEMFSSKDPLRTTGLPLGIVHGDLWTHNLLFRTGKEGKCTEELLAVIDWQTMHAGNPMEDMCRLLISSCPSALRRTEKNNLLKHYYEQCTKHYGGPLAFDLATLHKAYNFALPFGLAFYSKSLPITIDSSAVVGEEGHSQRAERRRELLQRARDVMEDCASEEIRQCFEETMKRVLK